MRAEGKQFDTDSRHSILGLSERIKENNAANRLLELDLFRYKESIKNKLQDFAHNTTVDQLAAQFELYATKLELCAFENRVKPLVVNCEQLLIKCRDDNQYMREAIVDFDMINATKATKWDLEEMKVWIKNDYVSI